MPKSKTRKKASSKQPVRPSSRSGPALASTYDKMYWQKGVLETTTPGIDLLDEHYLLPHSRVLDLGSGIADAVFLARAGHSVVAMDTSPVAIRRINQIADQESLDLSGRLEDITQGLPDGPFDIVMMMAVSHHLTPTQFAKLLETIKSNIIPSGYIYVRLMDANSAFARYLDWQPHYFCPGENEIDKLFPGWEVIFRLTNEVPAYDTGEINTYTVALVRRPMPVVLAPYKGSGPTAF